MADEVWAARAPAGVVSQGFVGLRLGPDGAVDQVAIAGQALAAGKNMAGMPLWWVRTQPWWLRFAPEPELAPEAGLALEIEPFAEGGEYGLLTPWLAEQRADVVADTFAAPLRQHPKVRTLPPCVTSAVLGASRVELHAYAVGRFGVRVLSLRRVDLPPPAANSPASADVAPQAVGADVIAVPAPGNVATTWADLVSMDRRACRRLAAELPVLDRKLRKRWSGQGWSNDVDTYMTQRSLQQRLGLLAGKFGRPTSVEQRFAPGHGPDLAQRQMVAAASLRAEQALGQAWAAVEGLQADTMPSSAELSAVADAIDRLEHEVNRRLRAWWKVDA